jgi:hypothetical protein
MPATTGAQAAPIATSDLGHQLATPNVTEKVYYYVRRYYVRRYYVHRYYYRPHYRHWRRRYYYY